MKEKKTRRWLSLLLTVVMVLSLLPAAVVPAAAANETDDFYRIVHLDCGRKYFSPEWVVALLNEMKNDGYNQLQLAFGNDGLRFLLDDMSFTANGTTYSHEDVVSKIEAGNKAQNSSGDASWLTQSEMDEIIAIANDLGIEIVPLLNLPGHANAILDIVGDKYNASGSNNTLNVADANENSRNAAQEFGKAIFKKYVDYFAGEGCKFFNFGADEYANDASGTFSFSRLNSTQYGYFVSFINDLAKTIEDAGMTPRAFNDGLYYNNQNVTIDTNIQCCYWSPGWSSYNLAAASTITKKHAMINTNGDFYYVLGKSDKFDSDYSYAANFNKETFPTFNGSGWGTENVNNPAGSMFCIWCDYPDTETETEVAQKVRLPLRAMALRMDGGSIDGMNTDVVTNGFNADGSINNSISGGNPGGNPDGSETAEKVTKEITVAEGATYTDTIEGYNYANNSYETEDPSIATVKVTGTTVDAKKTLTEVTDANFNFDADKQYLIVNTRVGKLLDTEDTATWSVASGLALKEVYAADTSADSTKTWTIRASRTQHTIANIAGKYLSIESNRASLDGTSSNLSLAYKNGTWTISQNNYYLNDFGNNKGVAAGWNGSGASTDSGSQWKIYEVNSTGGTASTKVTFTGVKANAMTTVTIGHVTYNIHVVDPDLANEKLPVEYWITNRQVEDNNGAVSKEITAADTNVHSETGVQISQLLPSTGSSNGNPAIFWKATRLTSGNEQTKENGVDQTRAGDDFTYIRYWNGWAFSTDGKTWTEIADDDQIVAYYMQRTQVTSEVTTDVTDWGADYADWKKYDNGDTENTVDWFWRSYVEDGSKFVFLDFATVYEDNTQNPSSFPVDNTWFYHFDGCSKDNPRVLGRMAFSNTEQYEIWKITVTDGDCTGYRSSSTFTPTYDDNTETVVWDSNMGGEPVIESLSYTANRSGKLIRIYIRAKVTEDKLTVHYMDRTANNTQFYYYNISVAPTTAFSEAFALDENYTDIKKALSGNTVENIKGVTQTVTADLSTMPEIKAQYLYAKFRCVAAERVNNGKDVYLYYTFENTHSVVIDFGLPVNIKPETIGITGNWTDVSVDGAKFGEAKVEANEGLTYTPTKVLTEPEILNLTLRRGTGADNKSQQQIYIYPASNVLYEDSFLTVNTSKGQTYADWTTRPSKITAQQTADQNTLYGYDNAYASSTGNSMGSAWTITGLKEGKGSKYLTTTFNGTGFDLIGTSGPNTGYVYLVLQGPENRVVVIDTSYGEGTLYQVPLAHLDGLKAGTYTVNIRAAYRAAPVTSTAAGTNSIAAYSLQNAKADALNDVYEEVESMLPAGMDLDDCEFVYADPESPLAELDNSSVAAYALQADEAPAATASRPAGTTVTIDGFRVYRDANNSAYTKSEQGVQYVNVLDQVNDRFTAYVEGSDGQTWNKDNYEANGGPQNEVYLGNGHAIAFKVNTNEPIQISARAVSGTAQLVVNGATVKELTSNTEMYYTVTPKDGVVAISNDGDNMLALGNLKLPASTGTQALTAADEEIVLSLLSMDPAPAFAPKLSAAARSFKVIRNKLVTVTVHASTDVARLTINGKTVFPTNGLLVKRGWSKEYIYLFTDTVKRDASKTYEIIAYNADGTASAPVQVTG